MRVAVELHSEPLKQRARLRHQGRWRVRRVLAVYKSIPKHQPPRLERGAMLDLDASDPSATRTSGLDPTVLLRPGGGVQLRVTEPTVVDTRLATKQRG